MGLHPCLHGCALDHGTPGKRRLGIRVVDDRTDEVAHRGIALREVVIKPGLLLLAVGPVFFFGGISLVAGSSANVLRELFSVLSGPWWLLLLVAPIVMCVGFFDFLSMTWDPRLQGWHDKAAGTRVIRIT